MHAPCDILPTRLAEIVDAGLTDPALIALRAHADGCSACSLVVARHRRIAALFSAPVTVPEHAIAAPRMPAVRRIAPQRLAAAAVFLAAVAALVAFELRPSPPPAPRRPGEPVQIVRIFSVRASPGIPDEELLLLSSGAQAVASLRPALAE